MIDWKDGLPHYSYKFMLDILDSMTDWVRVVDKNKDVIYMNKAMRESLSDKSSIGNKCYHQLGRFTACENCTCKKTLKTGKASNKVEVYGDRIYSVMSSPITTDSNNIQYVIEVLRDITKDKEMESQLVAQNNELQKSLDLAKKIQMSMLPSKQLIPSVEFSYIYEPCETLGGDFFNIFTIDKEHVCFYIADASGHGITASMLTVFLRTAFKKNITSPSLILKSLYKDFNESKLEKELYITVFLCVLNTKTGELIYSNAGHNCPPLVIGNDGIKEIESSGVPISNWLDEPLYEDKSIIIKDTDKIFLYTDGITNHWILDIDQLLMNNEFIELLKINNENFSFKYIELENS